MKPQTFLSRVSTPLTTEQHNALLATAFTSNTGLLLFNCILAGYKAYTCVNKNRQYKDYSRDVKMLAQACNIRLIEGNDAPRGGKGGNYLLAVSADIVKNKMLAAASEKRALEAQQAVIHEAGSLTITNDFKSSLAAIKASGVQGAAKSDAYASAMKALLEANGAAEIKTDFWKVFRILKNSI